MLIATSLMTVMTMANIAPIAVLKPTSLAFRARVITITPPSLPDVPILPVYNSSLPGRSVQTTTLVYPPIYLRHSVLCGYK